MQLAYKRTRNWLIITGIAIPLTVAMPVSAETEIAATQPATQPATDDAATTQNELDHWLTRIGNRADELKTLQARLRIEQIVGIVGDVQARFGSFSYDAGPPGRFALHIDRLVVDERPEDKDHWFIFDGDWLVERDNHAKLFNKRQVRNPNDETAAVDPLASGEGPFVLPLRFDKDRLMQRFDVSLIAPQDEATANAVGIRLTPREGVRVDVTQVDLWYSRETALPVEIHTKSDGNSERRIFLLRQRVDEKIDDKVFNVKEPADRGWRVDVREWSEE
jgi:outer membrane lipoprotein-sorting protein